MSNSRSQPEQKAIEEWLQLDVEKLADFIASEVEAATVGIDPSLPLDEALEMAASWFAAPAKGTFEPLQNAFDLLVCATGMEVKESDQSGRLKLFFKDGRVPKTLSGDRVRTTQHVSKAGLLIFKRVYPVLRTVLISLAKVPLLISLLNRSSDLPFSNTPRSPASASLESFLFSEFQATSVCFVVRACNVLGALTRLSGEACARIASDTTFLEALVVMLRSCLLSSDISASNMSLTQNVSEAALHISFVLECTLVRDPLPWHKALQITYANNPKQMVTSLCAPYACLEMIWDVNDTWGKRLDIEEAQGCLLASLEAAALCLEVVLDITDVSTDKSGARRVTTDPKASPANRIKHARTLLSKPLYTGKKVDSCDVCGLVAREHQLKRCSRCQIGRVCGPECSKKGWPFHKKVCFDAKSPLKPDSSFLEKFLKSFRELHKST